MEDLADLDQLQAAYKAAVDAGLDAIRREEALASVTHDVAEVDKWEAACSQAEVMRKKAQAAKAEYEAALREFLGFDVESARFASLIEKFCVKQVALVKD
jgi:uncharacterized phage protein gp47/JayE